MDTLQLTIDVTDEAMRGQLIAELSEVGFDAFEEQETSLLACSPAGHVDAATLHQVTEMLNSKKLNYRQEMLAQQNWNAAWEAGYEPVSIDDFCIVRAGFHAPAAGYEHEIIITPKMSFGTGHHATTKTMMRAMRGLNFKGKLVLDFGAGTGVLAILAVKLGAARVLAIDHEEWAAENAAENGTLNNVSAMEVRQGSLEQAHEEKFDLILANINRNILLQYMASMSQALLPGGQLLVSGILVEDEAAITVAARDCSLIPAEKFMQDGWSALLFAQLASGD